MGTDAGQDGDAAFRQFVLDQRRSLLRTAYLLTGDHGHAEDLVQLALLKTRRHWGRVSGRGDPTAHVRRVLVTTHTSWRRRLSSTEQVMETMPDGLADPAAERDEELVRALRALPPRMRAVVVLRFYEDRSEAQTAELLGCSDSTTEAEIAARYRVLRAGAVVAEGMPAALSWPSRTFDPPQLTPVRPGSSEPDPTAVDQAITEVAGPTGLDEDTLDPVLLWSGLLPAPDGETADAVVLALTMPSGAVVVSTAYADVAADGSGVGGPCGASAHPAGTPVGDLVVVTACEAAGASSSGSLLSYLVSTPAGVTRVELLGAGGALLAEQSVVDGSAVVRDSGPAVRARLFTGAIPLPEQPVTRGAPDGLFDRVAG